MIIVIQSEPMRGQCLMAADGLTMSMFGLPFSNDDYPELLTTTDFLTDICIVCIGNLSGTAVCSMVCL